MKSCLKILLVTLAYALSGSLYALDDQRHGFFWSFGAGFSFSEYDESSFERSSREGLGTSFKIGGGVNDNTVGYYVRHVAWSAQLENSLVGKPTISIFRMTTFQAVMCRQCSFFFRCTGFKCRFKDI